MKSGNFPPPWWFIQYFFLAISGFLDDSNSIKDVPLLYQLYRLIESTKENGISESEASAYLGQSKLNGRAMIRSLLREKQIEYYNTSKQRQTVRQYVN